MKRLFVLCVVLFAGIGQVEGAITYNARQDFSEVDNPNGVWSYGYSYTLGGSMEVYPDYLTDYTGESTWRDDNLNDTHDIPNISERDVTFWGFTLGPDDLIIHPGPDSEYSIIRWTAPDDGTVDVEAGFAGIHFGNTEVFVYHNADMLYDAALYGYAVATPFNDNLSVNAGDTIDFAVGMVVNAGAASTSCSAIIEFAPETPAVPEPSTFIVWSLLSICALAFRRR